MNDKSHFFYYDLSQNRLRDGQCHCTYSAKYFVNLAATRLCQRKHCITPTFFLENPDEALWHPTPKRIIGKNVAKESSGAENVFPRHCFYRVEFRAGKRAAKWLNSEPWRMVFKARSVWITFRQKSAPSAGDCKLRD
jgi:hypothetical protein